MKMSRRIIALVLAVLMLVGNGISIVRAAPLRRPAFETSYVNPLYGDVLKQDDLTPSGSSGFHASAASEEEIYYTPDDAAGQMRPMLVNRQETIIANVWLETFNGTQAAFKELCLDIVNRAMEHTGVPTEGDYLRWQFGGYNAEAGYSQTADGLHLLRITFTFTYYTDAAQEAELDAAVNNLLAELAVDEEDAYSKLKAIYDHICANVEYDNANVDNKNYKLQYTAYAALINGTAVCQGYSLLLYRLALELGVDCRLISGDGGGPHAWNIAQLDALYYNMDPTWDAGKSTYSYFLRCPANFSRHTRDAEYDTAAFHSAYPMAEHDYVYCAHVFEGEVTASPNCTEDGVMTYTCSLCGYSYADAIPATGHSYDDGIITAPTCTDQGYTSYTCLVCGDSHIDSYTDALGHDYGAWYTIQEPTCTAEGIRQRDCRVCGTPETEKIPLLDHSYTAVITDPTCTEQGFTTHTCTCGDSYVDSYTDALGHDYGAWYTVQEPTCTADGIRQHDCQTCGASETEVIPALGHTYTAAVTEPTCTEQGFTTYTCACGENYEGDYTDALGHNWIGTKCNRCDAVREIPFTDVPEESFYTIPVMWAVDNGITTGATETTYDPNGDCLRGHVVVFLWRARGEPEPTTTYNPFTDVKETDFFYKAVLWAVENGITNGTTADTFSPYLECNRAQVVTFLWRTVGKPAPSSRVNPFTDVKLDQFYGDAVLWAVENEITNGMDADTFGVLEICNRAHVVTFLHRAFVK